MKRIGSIVLVMFFFLIGFGQKEVQARSYEITKYDGLVEIQRDGSNLYTESIKYDF